MKTRERRTDRGRCANSAGDRGLVAARDGARKISVAEIAIGESRNTFIDGGSRLCSIPVAQHVEELLRPFEREGRDDHVAAAREGVGDRLVELLDRCGERPVQAVAVGRFHHHDVGAQRGGGGRRAAAVARHCRDRRRTALRRRRPASSASTSMLAEPRMWPASRKVARRPGASSSGSPYSAVRPKRSRLSSASSRCRAARFHVPAAAAVVALAPPAHPLPAGAPHRA